MHGHPEAHHRAKGPEALPESLTTCAFRRCLPSIAHALKYPLEQRKDLGNWADCVVEEDGARTAESMSVRYSSQRLESSASVKRVCFSVVQYLAKQLDHPNMSQVSLAAGHRDKMEASCANDAWGAHSAAPEVQLEPPDFSDDSDGPSASSPSSSTSDDASSSDDSIHLPATEFAGAAVEDFVFQWIRPKTGNTKIAVALSHVLKDAVDAESLAEDTALCKRPGYMQGFRTGTDIHSSDTGPHRWCPSCLMPQVAIMIAAAAKEDDHLQPPVEEPSGGTATPEATTVPGTCIQSLLINTPSS